VKIRIDEIKDTESEAAFVEEVSEINEALARTGVVDYRFQGAVPVHVRHYRLGSDLFFRGEFTGRVFGTCARCLEDYPFSLHKEFTFVLKPHAEQLANQELTEEDVSLSFYQGDEVDLAPLVRETLILSLPTIPLCSDECRGLCPNCGVNRNVVSCTCVDQWVDPRLAGLRMAKR
jgi:uncharacterized protein